MGAGEALLWAQLSAEGWRDAAPELYGFLLEIGRVNAVRQGTVCFFAERGEIPIAVGVLCLHEGVATLAGACTLPEYRKQGAQASLLRARLEHALGQGCDLAMMCARPGSASQRNAERQGFRIAYTRVKWHLEGRSSPVR
jgi:GNAT superfamily N-acetyltransferase